MDAGDFRLKIHQFLFASFHKIGYKLIKGKNLDKIISEGSVIWLCRQGTSKNQQTFFHTFLPKEKLLTISCITPGQDVAGRDNSHNRTVIIDTTQLEQLFYPILSQEIPLNPPKELAEITLKITYQ